MNAAPPKTAPTQSSRPSHLKTNPINSTDSSTTVVLQGDNVENPNAALPVGQARRAVAALTGTDDTSYATKKELHDIEFYNDLVEELPNCPVVHSILHTHRCVLEDLETPEEAMKQVDNMVSLWKMERVNDINKANKSRNEDEALHQLSDRIEADKKEEARNEVIRLVECRISELEKNLRDNVENVVLSKREVAEETLKQAEAVQRQANIINEFVQHGESCGKHNHHSNHTSLLYTPPIVSRSSPFSADWKALQDRILQREQELMDDCEKMEYRAKQTKEREIKFEIAAAEAKVGINEQVERGLLYSEEERYRVHLRKEAGVNKERVQHQEDAIAYIQEVVIANQCDRFAEIRSRFYDGFRLTEREATATSHSE